MPSTRVDGTAAAKIRAFFAIGRKSRKQCGERMQYRSALSAAAQVGLDVDTFGKARQLADPEKGYTREELEDFLRQCRRAGYAVGHSFLILLLRAPKKDRPWFQRRMLKERWCFTRLESELLRRYGRRRQGGRARRLPEDVGGLLVMIEGMCEKWRRWHWEATYGGYGGSYRRDPLLRSKCDAGNGAAAPGGRRQDGNRLARSAYRESDAALDAHWSLGGHESPSKCAARTVFRMQHWYAVSQCRAARVSTSCSQSRRQLQHPCTSGQSRRN